MKGASLFRGLLLAALAAGIAASLFLVRNLDEAFVQNLATAAGSAAPVLFVAGYALATVIFLPGSILTIAGGALFGPVAGTLYSLTGATLGATFAFLIARYLAADLVARRTGGRLAEFIDGVEAEGWRFVAFVRLVPLFPFNALNYVLGLTRISLRQYVVASFLAMLPGAAAYSYLGYAGREALAGSDSLVKNGLVALALIAAVAFLPRIARRMRHSPDPAMMEVAALEHRIATGEPLSVIDVRGGDEYNGDLGHIPGSVNVPLDQLPARLAELRPLKPGSLVLVCRTDRRSAKAADLLRAAGFGSVDVLRGGMEKWNSRSASMESHDGENTVRAK